MASVAFSLNELSTSRKRQKPTRMPYSCHAQFGRSGSSGCPNGGDRTVRGIGRSIDHSSTLTIVQTAIRAPPGSGNGLRSTIAEYGTRSDSGMLALPREVGSHQLRLDALGFRGGEIQLDLDAVRIEQEQLEQRLAVRTPLRERNSAAT